MPGSCVVANCSADVKAKGLCGRHYARKSRNGDPEASRPRKVTSNEERFWRSVRKTPTCWQWTGLKTKRGWGTVFDGVRRMNLGAHRMAYELLVGPIPTGMTIDHRCHTVECREGDRCPHRACVNPAHLKPEPAIANAQRTGHATRAHCKNGHEFTPENTYLKAGSRARFCRACVAESSLDYYYRNHEKRKEANRQRRAQRTHCERGHELTPDNTIQTTRRGYPFRMCRACQTIRVANRFGRVKAS